MTTQYLTERLKKIDKVLVPEAEAEMKRHEFASDEYVFHFQRYKALQLEYNALFEEEKRRNQFDVWAGKLHD